MAARAQPVNRWNRAIVLALAVAFAVALGRPGGASAHSGTVVNALDYRARVSSSAQDAHLVTARVLDGDRRIELTVAPSATLVVLGFQDEPLIRFSPAGVEVNERSPSALADRLTKTGAVPALDPHAPPDWFHVSNRHRYAWHDHRLGPIPGRVYGEGDVAGWTIPYVVDGRTRVVGGRLLHQRGPPLWPWLVGLATTGAIAAALASQRRRVSAIETTTFVAAALGSAAAVLLSVAFGFVAGRSTIDAWATVAACLVVGVAALALFVRAPQTRHGVAGFIGMLALLVGLSDASVLVHGFVISPLPATLVRAAVVVACCAGSIAVVLAAALMLQTEGRKNSAQRRPPAMAIPRGRP